MLYGVDFVHSFRPSISIVISANSVISKRIFIHIMQSFSPINGRFGASVFTNGMYVGAKWELNGS